MDIQENDFEVGKHYLIKTASGGVGADGVVIGPDAEVVLLGFFSNAFRLISVW